MKNTNSIFIINFNQKGKLVIISGNPKIMELHY